MFDMAKLLVDWNDPKLPDKARQFFLELYAEKRAESLARHANRTVPSAAPRGAPIFSLDADNLPDDILEKQEFVDLLSLRDSAKKTLATVMPETVDAETAATTIIRRALLYTTIQYSQRPIWFLLFDKRFNPANPVQIDATGAFDFSNSEESDRQQLTELSKCAALCNIMLRPLRPNVTFARELESLHTAGIVFFNTAQILFPINEVAKCSMAFTLLLSHFGSTDGCDYVANFIRRRKTMFRKIVEWQRNGGQLSPAQMQRAVENGIRASGLTQKVEQLTDQTDRNTKVVANMDRRQKTLFDYLKKTIGGFIKLFRPNAPQPSRERVAAELNLSDRYACLSRITEPHRSQIKAVIDHTVKHPIVHRQKKRDDYTLANAVREVWNANEAKWSHISGVYETFEQLKAACYNLQQKGDTDPFAYVK